MCENGSRPVTRPCPCGAEPANVLLICSDLLDLCGEPGFTASRGCRSLRDAVNEAQRRRNQRQREAHARLL
jgi:hypothetical protein